MRLDRSRNHAIIAWSRAMRHWRHALKAQIKAQRMADGQAPAQR
jgi:hypothetical protein